MRLTIDGYDGIIQLSLRAITFHSGFWAVTVNTPLERFDATIAEIKPEGVLLTPNDDETEFGIDNDRLIPWIEIVSITIT